MRILKGNKSDNYFDYIGVVDVIRIFCGCNIGEGAEMKTFTTEELNDLAECLRCSGKVRSSIYQKITDELQERVVENDKRKSD